VTEVYLSLLQKTSIVCYDFSAVSRLTESAGADV
jgi:hypothetical protein